MPRRSVAYGRVQRYGSTSPASSPTRGFVAVDPCGGEVRGLTNDAAMQASSQTRRSHARVDVVDAADAPAYLAKNLPAVVRLPGAAAWLERWSPEAMEARFGATIELEDAVAVYVEGRSDRRWR